MSDDQNRADDRQTGIAIRYVRKWDITPDPKPFKMYAPWPGCALLGHAFEPPDAVYPITAACKYCGLGKTTVQG